MPPPAFPTTAAGAPSGTGFQLVSVAPYGPAYLAVVPLSSVTSGIAPSNVVFAVAQQQVQQPQAQPVHFGGAYASNPAQLAPPATLAPPSPPAVAQMRHHGGEARAAAPVSAAATAFPPRLPSPPVQRVAPPGSSSPTPSRGTAPPAFQVLNKYEEGRWTADEQERFLEGVRMYGPRDWHALTAHIGSRCVSSSYMFCMGVLRRPRKACIQRVQRTDAQRLDACRVRCLPRQQLVGASSLPQCKCLRKAWGIVACYCLD